MGTPFGFPFLDVNRRVRQRTGSRYPGKAVGYATRSPALVLHPGTGRRGRGVASGGLRGRYAGRYRKAGFYGRYNRRNGGGELKFHDLDIDDTDLVVDGQIAIDSIVKIPQGVTEKTRVGRKCTVKSINWRFDVQLDGAQDQAQFLNDDVVRVILYHDKQTNGATAAITDILETDDYQSFNNLANKSRFRTLMDRTYNLSHTASTTDGTNTGSYGAAIISDSFFKKLNMDIEFSSTTGAITEIRSNNMGVLILTREGSAPSFASKMRVRFSDG